MYLEDLSCEKSINHKDTILKTYVLNRNKDGSSNHHSNSKHSSNESSRRSNTNYNEGNRNTNSLPRTNNNVLQSTNNNIEDDRLLFYVDTINDGRGSRALATPASRVAFNVNDNSSFTYEQLPTLAYDPNTAISQTSRAPIPSNIERRSINSPLYESPRSAPNIPRAPAPSNLSTPSTMSPLFPSQENINYLASNNQGVANNARYSSSNYSNSIVGTSAIAPNNTNTCYSSSNNSYSNAISRALLDADIPNTPVSSTSTNQRRLGLNCSNERL